MAKESTHEHLLNEAVSAWRARIPAKYCQIFFQFVDCYRNALGDAFDAAIPNLLLFMQLIEPHFQSPFVFEPYHKKIRHPIDYFQFGLDFIRPLVDISQSRIFGEENLIMIREKLQKKENVILLANHQTESDPQAISILLEQKYLDIAQNIIYVAGERVLTDPLAIPFSMGCDLLCIYSKRYIDHPSELKAQKQQHNKNTMERMSRLLQEGGKIIYVAPSGGRDRKNKEGKIEVAAFDPASIEMFYLMAKKAKTPTHFIPFSLVTYDLLPPPETVQKELGEVRRAKRTPIFLSFAPPFEMERSHEHDKQKRRELRAQDIWTIVNQMHGILEKELS